MALTPQWLDELRTRVSLSAVIGRTARLTKAGREFKACCPFHEEKSPSFTVSDEKGFYHCFGCGAHGDVIRWMTDQRGLAFMDAVKELAVEAGMDLPAPDPRAARQAEQRQSLHDVMAAAQAWFVANLADRGGEAARRYLAGRGFPEAALALFGFGFAPDSRTALREALKDFPEPMLVESGLRIAVDGREPYDRFRNRLMLPIQDARGRVIAFGGRILDVSRTDAPKYLNSPDTPLFDKGRTLFNLHRAGPAARRTGRVVVVEGYMDVVALSAAGIEESVAPLGTALTEHQLALLWRIADTPLLCFDGDAAGRRAAMRACVRALPHLAPGRSVAIAMLPAGLDPDDLVRRDGAAGLEALLAQALSLVEMLWEHEHAAGPLATPEDKAGLKHRLLEHVATIANADIRALYRRELLARYDAFAFAPRARPERGGRGWRSPAPAPLASDAAARLQKRSSGGAHDGLAAAVLAGLLRHPAEIARHVDGLAQLEVAAPPLARLIDALIGLAGRPDVLEPQALATILAELQLHPPSPADYSGLRFAFLEEEAPEDLAEALRLLIERPALDRALLEATARFASDPDGAFADQQRLLKRKLAFERRLMQMATARAAPRDQSNE